MGDAATIRDLDAALLLSNMKAVASALQAVGADVREVVIAGGRHHERDWAARFGDVVAWMWATP